MSNKAVEQCLDSLERDANHWLERIRALKETERKNRTELLGLSLRIDEAITANFERLYLLRRFRNIVTYRANQEV